MPPNRKGSTDIAQSSTSVTNLANFVTTTKYQPLTQLQENVQAVQEILPGQADSVPVVSYWDWPTDVESPKEVVVERILEKERIRQLFSVNHIESNLIAAAEKAASLKEDTVAVTVLPKETDDYWYTPEEEHVEVDTVPVASQCAGTVSGHATGVTAEPPQNYWYFPAFKVKERVAEAVMEEERIRQMLTVNHIQERLVEQCSQNTEPSPLEATNDAYWVF
jgi:hypothetical protein